MATAELNSRAISGTSGARAKAPVFVVGSPRSGTTLLYHMILSAGNFAVYRSETHIFNVVAAHFGNLRLRLNRERMMDQWLQSKYFRLTGLDASALRDQVVADARNAGDFLRIVMTQMAKLQRVERWAENTPEHVLYLREIKHTIPDALIIHIIRDGRDVALSLQRKEWVSPFPWDRRHAHLVCGAYWDWMVRAGQRVGPRLGPDYLEIHYEDLVRNPSATLAQVGRFIEHDLDYDRILRVGIGSVSEPNTSFSGGIFSPVGRWKQEYSPEQLADLEALIGPSLRRSGYELSTPAAPRPSLAVRRLRAQYLSWFSLRLWVKSWVPGANHFVDAGWLRESFQGDDD